MTTRRADGDPHYDLGDVCDFNEHLIMQAENQKSGAKVVRATSEAKGRA